MLNNLIFFAVLKKKSYQVNINIQRAHINLYAEKEVDLKKGNSYMRLNYIKENNNFIGFFKVSDNN